MAARIPVATDKAEVTHTAGRMSKGVALPAAMRTAATVVGISWMDAVLHTTSMHSASEATPGLQRLIRPGDGYYESCVLAVEGNQIEITV